MSAIRQFLLVALLAAAPILSTPDPADADGLDPVDAGSIRSVIERQLAAFQADDSTGAFAFASPGIQARFQTAENFMQMVRTGYAPVYRPQAVEFRDLVPGPQGPVQAVHIVEPDGSAVIALYSMEQQPDGSWRINGCALTAAPDLGA